MPKRNNRGERDKVEAEAAPEVKREQRLRNVVNGFGGRFEKKPKKQKQKKTRQTMTPTDVELQNSRIVIADMIEERSKIEKKFEEMKLNLQCERVNTEDLQKEIVKWKQHNSDLKEKHKRVLKQEQEQKTEQKKQCAAAKAQTTRIRNEMRQMNDVNALDVLRSALQMKSFEVTELKEQQKKMKKEIEELKKQTEQTEQTELTEQTEQFATDRIITASAQLRPRNVKAWAARISALVDKKFASDAIVPRVATLRLCLEEELAKLPQDVNENSLTDRRVFYALEKLTDARVGRERSLQMALEVLPQGTLMDALPPMLVMDIVGHAEKDLVDAIQAEYDIETCLNLKFKNSLSVRQWNRSRLLLSCFLNSDGLWARKMVGTTNVYMPILPEHRHLVNMQRDNDIEDEYGVRLDGTRDGTSCSISLFKSLQADIDYNLSLGELVYSAEGAVTTKKGEVLQVQLKMDACRAMSKIQQTSVAYSFPNGCEVHTHTHTHTHTGSQLSL
jgi:hypothetical protein